MRNDVVHLLLLAPGNEERLDQGLLKAALATMQPRILARGRAAGNRKSTAVIVLLAVAAAVPLCAQQSRVYREGAAWVEETTGTLPVGREIKVNTDLGSVQVQGNSPNITYVIRKRSF